MVCLQTKNPNFGKIWRVLEWKIVLYVFYVNLEYFTVIWYNVWLLGIVCGHWVYFLRFGILDQEKSGNPGPTTQKQKPSQLSWDGCTHNLHVCTFEPLPNYVNYPSEAFRACDRKNNYNLISQSVFGTQIKAY
jgi:hypothetical protein